MSRLDEIRTRWKPGTLVTESEAFQVLPTLINDMAYTLRLIDAMQPVVDAACCLQGPVDGCMEDPESFDVEVEDILEAVDAYQAGKEARDGVDD